MFVILPQFMALFTSEEGDGITGKFNFSDELISIDIPKGKLASLPSKLEKHFLLFYSNI